MTKLPPTLPTPYTTQTIALDRISANPANARKHFDDDELKALAASIAVQGLLQAPAVRPARAGGVAMPNAYTLIWGERRTKAAKLAGLKEIEVRIYDVDEVKAAELGLVENDQRVDLTPLERAAGYQELHKKHGLSYDAIADQVKKSRASVYEAVKLLELGAEAKKALVDGELSATSAALIASLPGDVQEQAVKVALKGEWGHGPMSSRDLKDWIRHEFMLDLKDAPFDTDDAQLCPAAGACAVCPKRTGFNGGQSDLFAGGEKGKKAADLCKDKACFDEKVAAHKKVVVATAKAAGKSVLNAADSKKALSTGYTAEYVKLDEGHSQALGDKTWGDALKGTKLEPQLAVTEDGKLVKVALKEDVKAALEEKGSKVAKSAALAVEEAFTSQPAKPDPKRDLREKVVPYALLLMIEKIEKAGSLTRALTVMLAQHLLETVGTNAPLQRRGWDGLSPKTRADRILHLPEKVLNGLIFELTFADYFNETYSGYDDRLVAASKELGVDLKQIEKQITDEQKAKMARAKLTDAEVAAGALDKPIVEKVATKKLAAEAKKKATKKPAKKAPKAKAKKKAGKR